MAVLKFYPVMSPSNGTVAGTIYAAQLGAAGNSANIPIGKDALIRIATQGGAVTVRFGASATLTNSGVTDILIPQNWAEIFDMGHQNDTINIYSIAANTYVSVSYVVRN